MSILPDSGLDLVYLIACALHETAPEKTTVDSMNLDEIFRLSTRNSIAMLVCSALQRCSLSGGLPDCWATHRNNALRNAILLDAERKSIFQELESLGIWYCPLKGYVLQDFYPGLGLREMGDTDVLFDPSRQKEVRDCFVRRGYQVKDYAVTNHDIYHKAPIFNFEMHTALFASYTYPELFAYWKDIASRLQPMTGTEFGRVMTPEDFYLFFLAHSYKHFANYGTGLRTLSDCWVLLNRQEDSMDRSYLERELEKLNLVDYERQLRLLAHAVFDQPCHRPELSDDQLELLHYLLECGTFGQCKTGLVRKIRKATDQMEAEGLRSPLRIRLRYLWRRLFPTEQMCRTMQNFSPYADLPFGRARFLAVRFVRELPQHRRSIRMELKLLFRK